MQDGYGSCWSILEFFAGSQGKTSEGLERDSASDPVKVPVPTQEVTLRVFIAREIHRSRYQYPPRVSSQPTCYYCFPRARLSPEASDISRELPSFPGSPRAQPLWLKLASSPQVYVFGHLCLAVIIIDTCDKTCFSAVIIAPIGPRKTRTDLSIQQYQLLVLVS